MIWYETYKIYAYLLSLSTEKIINVFILAYILYIYNLYLKSHMSIGTPNFSVVLISQGSSSLSPTTDLCLLLTHRRKLISDKINIFICFSVL